jgi:hypothetical protein
MPLADKLVWVDCDGLGNEHRVEMGNAGGAGRDDPGTISADALVGP